MNITEVFQVLGIEETKDEGAIKRAYREKLAVTNPEDNPEGFKRLRAAYEEACVYAKSDDAAVEEEVDDTPSGRWVQQVTQIYGNIHTRQQVELWEKLFEEDIFLALEEEENCRMKLLRFLMEHFKLPTDVWKLLGEKLHIVEDAGALKEYFPADFVSYIVNRCTQGEDIEFDKFEGAADANYDLFLQYSNNCWDALSDKQLEQAAEFLKNADELEIYHPVMELNRAWLWEKQGKVQEAVKWLKDLQDKYPDDVMIMYHLAEMQWKHEEKESAAEVFEAIVKINKKHYMSNMRLTEWYYEKGRYQDAKDCAEELLGMGVDDEFRDLLTKINHELEKDMEKNYREKPELELGLELGWCYLQDGRYSKGVSLVSELAEMITPEKKSEYRGLLAKLYAESAEYEAAIRMAEIWEEALEERLAGEQEEEERKKDEDRVRQSYAIRSYCYRRMGYKDKEQFNKAIECIEKVEAKDKEAGKETPDINMLLEKAFIYMEMDEFDKCLDLTRILIEDYQIYAAYATEQEAYRKMWDAEGVLQSGFNCIHYFPDYMSPYERIGKVYSDLQYTEDLEKLLADAKEQNFESVYLEAYAYRMKHEIPDNDVLDKKLEEFRKEYLEKLEEGNLEYYEKGLPILTEYLYWCPGAYMLVERGLFHKAACKYDEAIADLNRALEEEPGNPYALNALAYVYKMKGDYEHALICNRRAIYYFDEEYARSYANQSDLYSLLGEHKKALEVYEEVLRVGGDNIRESEYYMRRYAVLLVKNGQLQEAEKVISRAYGNHFERYSELAELYYSIGEEEKARVVLQRWQKALANSQKVVKKSDYARYHDSMAWTELVFGDGKRAIEYFEKEIQGRAKEDDISGLYCDTIFACILCGEDEKGMKYAAKLREFMKKSKAQGQNLCYEMDKIALEREFLMKYYTASEKELEEILEREDKTSICYFCTQCFCKEIEGIRVLHLLRTGKKEEAFAHVERILEKQPLDEWMRAIQNICKDGVKVVPYTVNGGSDTEQEQPEKKQSPKVLKTTKPEPGTTWEEVKEAQSKAAQEAENSKQQEGIGAKLKKMLSGIFKG
ncbi:MAG: tetratricopeptide repeat protein [Lachnospiraceae bacterium]|nr:tetratricopeptide repeat protein [Lachnospiraceae bacterium]